MKNELALLTFSYYQYRDSELLTVELCHAFNFLECDVITVTIRVSLVLRQKHHPFLIFSHI